MKKEQKEASYERSEIELFFLAIDLHPTRKHNYKAWLFEQLLQQNFSNMLLIKEIACFLWNYRIKIQVMIHFNPPSTYQACPHLLIEKYMAPQSNFSATVILSNCMWSMLLTYNGYSYSIKCLLLLRKYEFGGSLVHSYTKQELNSLEIVLPLAWWKCD